MLAKDLIADIIPPVSEKETVRQILERMAELKIAHLPVVVDSEYLGLISDADLGLISDPDSFVETKSIELVKASVFEEQHIYEVINQVSSFSLTLLPVLTSTRVYSGSITLPVLVKNFSNLTAAAEPGAILVLSLAPKDYSPTIISRIIEENNAKMISLYMVPDPKNDELSVTIKINTQETSSIMRSFDRYGYSVRSYFLANSQLEDFYRSRYEEFMKYMNV
jgi:CBS domain-containing protein